MYNKLTAVRLRRLAELLSTATDVVERTNKDAPDLLDPTLLSRLEDIEMEVGMALSDLEENGLI